VRRFIIAVIVVGAAGLALWLVVERLRGPEEAEDLGLPARVREVTLYFSDPDGSKLLPEGRRIPASGAVSQDVRAVVEALIEGPAGGSVATLPSSARVLGVYIYERTAVIDFSSEVSEDLTGGTTSEYMMVASLVQTVCGNFAGVEAVRIVIEGEEIETIGGHLRVSGALRPGDWR
jgi:spore germination protein GerM